MRFGTHYRRPRNADCSLDVRKGFSAIVSRYITARIANPAQGTHQLAGTSEALETERNELLEQLKSFDKKRSHSKTTIRRNLSFAKGSAVLQ